MPDQFRDQADQQSDGDAEQGFDRAPKGVDPRIRGVLEQHDGAEVSGNPRGFLQTPAIRRTASLRVSPADRSRTMTDAIIA